MLDTKKFLHIKLFFHFTKVEAGRVLEPVLLQSRHIRPDQGPSSGTSRGRSIAEYTLKKRASQQREALGALDTN